MPYKKFVIHFILFPLGIALLVSVLLFQEGIAISINLQSTPTATLSPLERLAKPTLPAIPRQADQGAQIYWLWCLPCHGDLGQGLTDEFRETYPPEEQFCWERGCHGKRPYENGFTIPMWVPSVIGSNAQINKYQTAANLYTYIKFTMPYWNPGVLTDEEVWNVTAFLLRENNLLGGRDVLDESNAGQIFLSEQALTPLPTSLQSPIPTQASSSDKVSEKQPAAWKVTLFIFVLIVIILILFVLRWMSSYEDESG